MTNELNKAFDRMTPNDTQKERMLNTILNIEQPVERVSYLQKMRRKRWISTVAVCLALVFAMMFMFRFGTGSVAFALSIGTPDSESRVKIMDSRMEREKFTTTVSNVNSRPDLEFYIEGKDIAKIELSCENEYLYVGTGRKHSRRNTGIVNYINGLMKKTAVCCSPRTTLR